MLIMSKFRRGLFWNREEVFWEFETFTPSEGSINFTNQYLKKFRWSCCIMQNLQRTSVGTSASCRTFSGPPLEHLQRAEPSADLRWNICSVQNLQRSSFEQSARCSRLNYPYKGFKSIFDQKFFLLFIYKKNCFL